MLGRYITVAAIIFAGCIWGAPAEQHEKVRLSDNLWFYRGMMYTQWGQDFAKLEEFAAAVRAEEGKPK